MPTYDYQCFACDYVFEEVQKITADPISKCPKCGEDKVKRLVSKSSFHLKGGGWYASGYSSTKANTGSSNAANSSANNSSAKKTADTSKTTSSSTSKKAES